VAASLPGSPGGPAHGVGTAVGLVEPLAVPDEEVLDEEVLDEEVCERRAGSEARCCPGAVELAPRWDVDP